MSNNINIDQQPNRATKGKVMAGVILLLVGAYLLLKQLNLFFFPHWLTLWPMWLIFAGLYTGAKNNYKKSSSPVLIALGVILMLTWNINNAGDFIWPIAIIALGAWIILRKKNTVNTVHDADYWDKKYKASAYTTTPPAADYTQPDYTQPDYTTGTIPPVDPAAGEPVYASHDDVLDAVAVFGGVNKTILSKNFRGGEIVNVFGGTELDFTQADINGRVVIDITQVFGGTKIIVPANWHVVPDMSAVFAGVDDKRIKNSLSATSNKVLVLKGISLFAGVDIRSY
ncbi:hypothetical protein FFF34_001125 [Inquilinus sp. KBS0705]|nr:hypothetical protein FFF34_001125 [Inquilinus sp. KBS0705]